MSAGPPDGSAVPPTAVHTRRLAHRRVLIICAGLWQFCLSI